MAEKAYRLALRAKKRDGEQCIKCGKSVPSPRLEAHHIVPRAQGGDHTLENLATLCRHCHRYAPIVGIERDWYRPLFNDFVRTSTRPETDLFFFAIEAHKQTLNRVSYSPHSLEEELRQLVEMEETELIPNSNAFWTLGAAIADYGQVRTALEESDTETLRRPGTEKTLSRFEDPDVDAGKPPTGLMYDDSGKHWVPDPDEIEAVLKAFALRKKDTPIRTVQDVTGIPRSTIDPLIEKFGDRIIEEAKEHGYTIPHPLPPAEERRM